MRGVVVDVNVIIEAIEGSKPDKSPALAEAQFMFKLFDSRNSVFVNRAIMKKYWHLAERFNRRHRPQDLNNNIHKIFMQTVKNSKRTNHIDGTKVDWPGLKKCDKEFVGVALQSGAILVTGDTRLRALVEDHPRVSDVTCVTARSALDMLVMRD